jgi:hypothetical protein
MSQPGTGKRDRPGFTEHQLAKLASSGLDAEFALCRGVRPVSADEPLGLEWHGSGAASPPGMMFTWRMRPVGWCNSVTWWSGVAARVGGATA